MKNDMTKENWNTLTDLNMDSDYIVNSLESAAVDID